MDTQANKSEVARLMEQIELECQAFRRMFEEPAIVASHDSIYARYERLGALQSELAPFIGEEQAVAVMYDTYSKIVG